MNGIVAAWEDFWVWVYCGNTVFTLCVVLCAFHLPSSHVEEKEVRW